MATRARIGIKQKSGRIIASYQHWDGYTGGLGYNLIENWEDPKKVAEAIKLAPKLKPSEIIIVNSCGDSLKDKDIIKKKLGSYIR